MKGLFMSGIKQKSKRGQKRRQFYRRTYEQEQNYRMKSTVGQRDWEGRPKCKGKKVYHSYGEALGDAELLFRAEGGNGGAVCVYPCPYCRSAYHVGHQDVLTAIGEMVRAAPARVLGTRRQGGQDA